MSDSQSTTDLIVFSSHPFGSTEVGTSEAISALARNRRVFFFEDVVRGVSTEATYFIRTGTSQTVTLVRPYLPAELSIFEERDALIALLKEFMVAENITHYAICTDTPKSMRFIRHLNPESVIYAQTRDYVQSHPELVQELAQYTDLVLVPSGQQHKHID